MKDDKSVKFTVRLVIFIGVSDLVLVPFLEASCPDGPNVNKFKKRLKKHMNIYWT